jgi:hypothetical protein
MRTLAPFLLTGVLLASCMTRSSGQKLANDLFNVQRRLLDLEQTVVKSSDDRMSIESSANKRLASSDMKIQEFEDTDLLYNFVKSDTN